MHIVSLKEVTEKDGRRNLFSEMIKDMISEDYYVVIGSGNHRSPDVEYLVWEWDSNLILQKADAIKFVMQFGGE